MSPNELPRLPCHLNGHLTTLERAQVSVMDRGFIFGDGVYEVIPVYAGRLFFAERHLARLARSLAELRISNPHSDAGWLAMAQSLIDAPCDDWGGAVKPPPERLDALIYLQITRGVALRAHPMLTGLKPTVFGFIQPMSAPSSAERERGAACVTAHDFRWEKAHIKSTSLLGSVMARQISVDAQAQETILFRGAPGQEVLSEAAACNVWVVKGRNLMGPVNNHHVLEGIRYSLMRQLCESAGLAFGLRDIARAEVLSADELLLTSASKEVMAVTQLDGRPVGSGLPGPIYGALYGAYQAFKQTR